MQPFSPRFGLTLAVGAGPSAAAGFTYSLYGGIGLHAERLTLSHDASSFDPHYGNPTSTLAYAPLVTVLPQVGLKGENDSGGWFDFLLMGAPVSGGTFTDSDYFAGHVLGSETLSSVGIGGAVSGELRVSLPRGPGWSFRGAPIEPYAVLRGGHRRLSALGLSCGAICPTFSPMGPDVAVIDEDIWSAAAGLGVQTALPLTPEDILTLGADLAAGLTTVADSHNSRADLGPTPNVLYDFATIAARGHVDYEHRLAEAIALHLRLDMGAQAGFGRANFGPRSPKPPGLFPATLTDIDARLSAGLGGKF